MISEFVKEKVFWTRKMNLKLVKFVQSKPHIWNPKHPKYTSTVFRDETYAQFAAKYNYEFSGQAVKDRWTNIRSTFANYLRKINAANENGQEYKVNWHLWEACQFLLKIRIKQNDTPSANNSDLETDVQDEEIPTVEPEINLEDSILNNGSNYLTGSNVDCDTILQGMVSVFKGVQNDVFGLDSSKYGKVGRTVTRKLSQMNSYDAARASQKIMEILALYDVNNPNNPNNLMDVT